MLDEFRDQLTCYDEDDVTVLEIKNALDLMSVEPVSKAMHRLLKAGHKRILVDMSQVRRTDSSGFGAMVAMQVMARNRLAHLAFYGMSANAYKSMKLLRLHEQLSVFHDRAQAVGFLRQGRVSQMQRTLVILKPDAIQRQLVGEIIARFERRGLKLVGLKMMEVPVELAEKHYGEHREKPFYNGLVDFITSSPVVVAVLEGENAVQLVRNMMGALDPAEARAGTIRGDYAISMRKNLVHGSDSPENAERELALWFSIDELAAWDRALRPWLI